MFALYIHQMMEIASALCLLSIAFLALKYQANGKYSTIIGCGALFAAVADITHAVLSDGSMLTYWEPFSWAASRTILLTTFMLVALCHSGLDCAIKKICFVLSIPVMLLAAQPFIIPDLSFVYEPWMIVDTIVVHRPLDLLLAGSWTIMSVLLFCKRKVLFPPYTYGLFMVQGVVLHLLMAFGSVSSLDLAAMLAHALKVTEYYTLIILYIMYKYIGTIKLQKVAISNELQSYLDNVHNKANK